MSYVWNRWLAREFRAAGLKVIEVDGWENRGRPASTGHYDPTEGVTVHHTGTTTSPSNPGPTLRLLITGRSDLPGPLCQWSVQHDGVVVVIAAGRGNHAGRIGKSGQPGMPVGGDGNALALGDEVDTNGTQPLTAAQIRSIAITNAVVLKHYRNGVNRVHRHADISGTGKWDLGNRSTARLRDDTARALDVPKMPPKPKPKPKPAPKPDPEPDTVQLAIATLNFGDGPGGDKTVDLDKIRVHAHIIGLQEAGDRHHDIERFLTTHPSWEVWCPVKTPGQGMVPILYRTDLFEFVHGVAVLAVPARRVVKPDAHQVGAGPAVIAPKYVSRLHLTHNASGRTVHVLNTHMIPSATVDKMPTDEKDARRRHYRDHADVIEKTVDGRDGLVFLTADLNATSSFRLLAPLKAAGLVGWTKAATHGRRSIDHVLHRESSSVRVVGERLMKLSSDHHAVIQTFAITVREHT